ncbi:MAG TPA: enoyl-CoA hydratase/isomerase family protein [Actinomycetota bacterium]|nr:enoyl-CoA hydratase/isomerase family protein [Actinomycetota bacterium]
MSVLPTDAPAPGILRLRMDRPDSRNAVDRELAEALLQAFEAPDAAVVILGSGRPGAFCSGLDLSLPPSERVAVSDLLYQVYERMLTSPAPIVASIGGPAIGGGAQLAIASDLRVAAPGAMIRFAGPGHGLAVGAWGLGSLVGRGRAMDLCLSMRPVSTDEAKAIGLVDRVADDPDAASLELATQLAGLDRAAVTRVKRLTSESSGWLEALRRERRENLAAWSGEIPEGALPAAPRDDA